MLYKITLIVDRDRAVQQSLELPVVGATGVYYEAGCEWLVQVDSILLLADCYEVFFAKLESLKQNPALQPPEDGQIFKVMNSYHSSERGWSYQPLVSGEELGNDDVLRAKINSLRRVRLPRSRTGSLFEVEDAERSPPSAAPWSKKP